MEEGGWNNKMKWYTRYRTRVNTKLFAWVLEHNGHILKTRAQDLSLTWNPIHERNTQSWTLSQSSILCYREGTTKLFGLGSCKQG